MKQGLVIAIEKWISHLIIESDSKTTIGLLNDNRNEKLSFLIDDGISLMVKIQQVRLNYITSTGKAIG